MEGRKRAPLGDAAGRIATVGRSRSYPPHTVQARCSGGGVVRRKASRSALRRPTYPRPSLILYNSLVAARPGVRRISER
jgi:hypothetical protein